MSGIIIQGSARKDGNTSLISEELSQQTGFDVVHLSEYHIKHFDYAFQNQDDDFPALIRKIAVRYQTLIFVTPVYWYSMSGMMKVFFDRISDCLHFDKETGRKFRGKNLAAVSSSGEQANFQEFFLPFSKSAEYLGMKYLGDTHAWVLNGSLSDEVRQNLLTFVKDKIT